MDVQFFKDLAEKASQLLDDYFKNAKKVCETKETYADIVTESDKKIEDFIIKEIKAKYPDHIIVAEESIAHPIKLTDHPTWFIDPIDGTSNFAGSFPFCCVSIGYYENQEPKLAAVYSPMSHAKFFAEQGKGSFLNGQKINVSDKKAIKDCLILGDYGGDRTPENLKRKTENMYNILQKARGVRTMGSAALHCCFVASGRADGFFEFGIHAWDYAAGVLIAKEAGGFCQSCDGGKVDLLARNIMICSNEDLAKELQTIIKPVAYDRD